MDLRKTIQFYFRQPALESVSMAELQKAVAKYPYCGPLHFLLLKKQIQENDSAAQEQFEKTSLYFPNIHLLELQLKQPSVTMTATAPALEKAAPPPEAAPKPAAGSATESAPVPTPEPASEPATEPSLEAASEPASQNPQPTTEFGNATVAVDEPAEAEKEEATQEASHPEAATPAEKQSIPESAGAGLRSELLMRESPIPIPSLKDISPQTDEQPLFEPYHTIDYFASQGIKLGAELSSNDRLGRQLRSFTDWIRTMKKLPQATIEKQLLDAGNGEKIVAMAAGSVEHSEVLTETMAEVLVKQGNLEKARDLYHKLSLAHPDKSAYFAARIEQLKNR